MLTDEKHLLFSYGTLRDKSVQLALFGRTLEGEPDALPGFRLTIVHIDDAEFVATSGTPDHRNLQFTGNPADVIEGTVFTVTNTELDQADAYEPAGYKRTLVQLRSGLNAWVYLLQAAPMQDPN